MKERLTRRERGTGGRWERFGEKDIEQWISGRKRGRKRHKENLRRGEWEGESRRESGRERERGGGGRESARLF